MGTIIAAKAPNEDTGIWLEKKLAKNATAVVEEVANIALLALFHE